MSLITSAIRGAICAGLKRLRSESSSSWHDAVPLVHTSGSSWAYQPSPQNGTKIAAGLQSLSAAWSVHSVDKSLRPVFTIASGPGTGKSRLLDEFPSLCSAAAASNSDANLVARLARAYVFKISFENGTPFQPVAEAALDGDSVVGTRMLWQLTPTTGDFSSFQSGRTCTISGALEILSTLTGVPRSDQVVFLLVDGLQKLLPEQDRSAATPPDPVKFRSAVNAVSACVNGFPECVVGAITATLAIPIRRAFGVLAPGGSQQMRVYLEPPPLLRPENVVPDIPSMPLLRVLRDDMGGHGRALELLASCLHTTGGDVRPFSSVASSVIVGLTINFEEWTSATGVKNLWEPLLYAVVSRRRLALSDVVPGTDWTVDSVRSLGLVRLVTDEGAIGLAAAGYLEMAVALLQVIRAGLSPGPLTTLVPDYAVMESSSRVAKNWQDFEDLVANFRAIKVSAFRDMPSVLLSDLHAGARLSAAAAATKVRVPPGHGIAARVLHPTTRYSTATLLLDAHRLGVTGMEGAAALHDVVINGASASAGDIFLRLDRLDRSSGDFIPELEVLACRHRKENVNAVAFDSELQKALGDRRSTSVFLFVTTALVHVDFGAPESSLSEGAGGGGVLSEHQTRSVSVRSRCACEYPTPLLLTCRFPAGRRAPFVSGSAPRGGARGVRRCFV